MEITTVKRTLSLLLSLALSCFSYCGCEKPKPVEQIIYPDFPSEYESTPVEYFRQNMKHGINFSYWDGNITSKHNPFVLEEKYYKLISEAGYDHIRLPIGFTNIKPNEDYTVTDEEFLLVDTAINYALKYNLMVVLDLHFFGNPGINKEPKSYTESFYSIWRQLSEHYKDYSNFLAFEILNEPSENLYPEKMDVIQNKAIEIIRETNPTRAIAAAANNINGVWSLNSTELPSLSDDPNIMITVHTYDPLTITHQGTDWENRVSKQEKTPWTDSAKSEIDRNFDVIEKYREETGRFIFIGEWGVCHRIADPETVSSYYDYFTKQAAERDIPWTVWEFCASFGIYDAEAEKWQPWAASLHID